MAAQVLLLLALIIHAEIILREGGSYDFVLDDPADFCSVSRWTGEAKELLLNTTSGSKFVLSPLGVAHSGQYQEQCWTRGNVTLERNSTLLVCDHQTLRYHPASYPNAGQTVKLTCEGAGPNQSIQWAYRRYRTRRKELVLIDDETPLKYGHLLVKNKSSLLLTVTGHSDDTSYFCLEKQPHRCVLRSHHQVFVPAQPIFRSVGESLELNCSVGSGNRTHEWRMDNSLWGVRQSLNSTLMFPSLLLAHSGDYFCTHSISGYDHYSLYVCPETEPEPPAVVLFTEGENLTLHCGDRNDSAGVAWLVRSNRTEGRLVDVWYGREDKMENVNRSLVVRNVSLQDSGQFWCVGMTARVCVFRSEFLVKLREPEVDRHLLRSVLLSAVVLMLCAVVGVKVWRSRRGEQLPAPVEELEMSQLSPESDVQEEAPV